MKRIAIIALCFVLAGCIMTGCRRNDMQDDMGGNTTITTIPDTTTVPRPTTPGGDSTVGSDPMDGNLGADGPMTRGPIHGSGM